MPSSRARFSSWPLSGGAMPCSRTPLIAEFVATLWVKTHGIIIGSRIELLQRNNMVLESAIRVSFTIVRASYIRSDGAGMSPVIHWHADEDGRRERWRIGCARNAVTSGTPAASPRSAPTATLRTPSRRRRKGRRPDPHHARTRARPGGIQLILSSPAEDTFRAHGGVTAKACP